MNKDFTISNTSIREKEHYSELSFFIGCKPLSRKSRKKMRYLVRTLRRFSMIYLELEGLMVGQNFDMASVYSAIVENRPHPALDFAREKMPRLMKTGKFNDVMKCMAVLHLKFSSSPL